MFKDNVIIIDVQGFYVVDEFFPKEVSILGTEEQIKTFIINPPCKFSELTIKDKNTNRWLYHHHHGLHWNDGNATLKDLENHLKLFIQKNMNPITIYVKGFEKLKLFQKIIGEEENIVNLDDLFCPNLNTLQKMTGLNLSICNYHRKHKNRCAVKNVILFRNFLSLYINKENFY